jgi:aryl-alcohol dehydrogenase-like predicted oxidoreductase
MRYRRFGRLGWQVSEVGHGMWGMGGWSGSDDDQSLAALQRSVDLGCNFFDTAWAYGEGKSEHLLGSLVRANRDKRLYTATKIPPKNRVWPASPDQSLDESYPPDHIEEYVQRSLKNSGLDSFDLVQLHTWTDGWAEDDRWYQKMTDLKRSGLFSGIGISIGRWNPEDALKAVRSGRVDSVQAVYNVLDRNVEDELFPLCQEMDVAVIARVPFDEGSLTGNLTKSSTWPEGDWRNIYFNSERLSETVDRVDALRPLLSGGMTMAELALRFVLSNEVVSTTIPGMRQLKNVERNVAASDAGPLPEALLANLQVHRWRRIA